MNMLNKEMLEKFQYITKIMHTIASILAVCLVGTLFITFIRLFNSAFRIDVMLNFIDKVLVMIDIFISILFLGMYLYRKIFVSNPHKVWESIISDKYLNNKISIWLKDDNETEIPTLKVKFCSENDMEMLSKMNYEAFCKSIFGTEKKKLIQRNMSLFQRNHHIFMMIVDPLDKNEYIGYSAVIPLNQVGLTTYLNTKIKDEDFSPLYVAKSKKDTVAFLLFAINLREKYSFEKSKASRNYTLYYFACIRYHFLHYFRDKTDYLPIYVQTCENSLRRRLERYGFKKTGKISGDGYNILVIEKPFSAQMNNMKIAT